MDHSIFANHMSTEYIHTTICLLQAQHSVLCEKKETLNEFTEFPVTGLSSVSQIQHSSVQHRSGEQNNGSVVRGLNEQMQVSFLKTCCYDC